jgi:hypothetical protein
MLLAQRFTTYEGVLRRARFEAAHSKSHDYLIVYCDENGEPLTITRKREVVCYRMRKISRKCIS